MVRTERGVGSQGGGRLGSRGREPGAGRGHQPSPTREPPGAGRGVGANFKGGRRSLREQMAREPRTRLRPRQAGLPTTAGRLAEKIASITGSEGYSASVCYLFTINYILGVGVLGMPNAFAQSGLLLGSGLIVLVTGVSMLTVLWVAECTVLVERVDVHDELSGFNPLAQQVPVEVAPLRSSSVHMDTYESVKHALESPPPVPRATFSNFLFEETIPTESDVGSGSRVYEVLTLCEKVLGAHGALLYSTSLSFLAYSGLVAYAQVFIASWMLYRPLDASVIPAAVFASVVVPLSCMDLLEQASVQVAMAFLRFLALATMLLASVFALISGGVGSANPNYTTPVEPAIVNWKGIGVMFSTALFSQLFQHSVPGLVQPLALEVRRERGAKIFVGALSTTGIIFIMIGSVVATAFGPAVLPSCNLNFMDFNWGASSAYKVPWGFQIAQLAVLFPAFDTLSVFPLIANTLGNNLAAARRGSGGNVEIESGGSWLHTDLLQRFGWKLAASLPPVCLAPIVSNLSETLQWAGLFGVVVAFLTPSMLLIGIQRSCAQRGLPTETAYSTVFSRPYCAWLVMSLGCVGLVVVTLGIYSHVLT